MKVCELIEHLKRQDPLSDVCLEIVNLDPRIVTYKEEIDFVKVYSSRKPLGANEVVLYGKHNKKYTDGG